MSHDMAKQSHLSLILVSLHCKYEKCFQMEGYGVRRCCKNAMATTAMEAKDWLDCSIWLFIDVMLQHMLGNFMFLTKQHVPFIVLGIAWFACQHQLTIYKANTPPYVHRCIFDTWWIWLRIAMLEISFSNWKILFA